MKPTIDLNADLGESYGAWTMGDDMAMLDVVTSANVACGFHGGDPSVMMATVRRCVERGVRIGAHPSFDDRQGFGRRPMPTVVGDELIALLRYQIGALQAVAAGEGGTVAYVKVHGALDNMASVDAGLAATCVEAVRGLNGGLAISATSGTELLAAAGDAGMATISGVYADRGYTATGQLAPRSQPGAVLHDVGQITERVLRMLSDGVVTSVDGVDVAVHADTVCVHGDTPGAVTIASNLRTAIEAAGWACGT